MQDIDVNVDVEVDCGSAVSVDFAFGVDFDVAGKLSKIYTLEENTGFFFYQFSIIEMVKKLEFLF